jgi:hypothetical protein
LNSKTLRGAGFEEEAGKMSVIRNTQKMLTLRVAGFLLGFFVFPLIVIGANSGFEIQPYVQNISKTSATISWKSGDEGASRVEYGPTAAYGASAEGGVESVVGEGSRKLKKMNIVRARLVDLVPDTTYHYRVMLSSLAGEDRTFHTAPAGADAAFTFFVYGDSRSDPEAHGRVVSAAANTCQPAFVLTTGDAVSSEGGGPSAWKEQFFGPADPLLRKTWCLLIRGNHEGTGRLFSLYFEGAGGPQSED